MTTIMLGIDILPRLKAGDSYAGQLNEALRFGGFPLHGLCLFNRKWAV